MLSSPNLEVMVIQKESNRTKNGKRNCQTGLEEEIQHITSFLQVDLLTRNFPKCSEGVKWVKMEACKNEKEDGRIEAPEIILNQLSYKSKCKCNEFVY